jgi:hypothetical protein
MRVNEGREIAHSYMRSRMKDPERGVTPACPGRYLVWTQGIDGDCRVAKEIRLCREATVHCPRLA